jgi:hypothetical protein
MSLRAWAAGAAGFICLTSSTTGLAQAQAAQEKPWRVIERSSFAWRPQGKPYTLVVEEKEQREQRLLIIAPDGRTTVIAPENGIEKLTDDAGGPKNLLKDKLTHSDFAYATPRLRGPDGAPLLLVQEDATDVGPGDLRLYTLDKQGRPSLLTVVKAFELIAIVDLAGDGEPELAGALSYSQVAGCLMTYDPRGVVRFTDRTHSRLVYSRVLSRAFNLKYYYGWAGPHSSERIGVALGGKHKGKVVGPVEARALEHGCSGGGDFSDLKPLPDAP